MRFRVWVYGVLAFAVANAAGDAWDVAEAGAVADGETDCTAAFQKALDAAGAEGGGTVHVPAGHYRLDGTLRIPGGVTLEGTFRVPPMNRHEGQPKMHGSVLLAYAGRGSREGEPFIRLAGSMATLAGVIISYPEWQQSDVPPVAYPPTVLAEHCENVGILDCCFLGTYEAIRLEQAARFIVRNVHGYPSFRGLYVDACYDIGRVENCHFWPFGVHYQHDDPYCQWVNTEGVAFEFARTDWQYVQNTFCFGYGVGYKFSKSDNGACNGNFLGIGADSCRRPVLVEDSQPPGLLITNGEFVGRWGSTDSVGIEILEHAGLGKVSLNNCSFWGPLDRCIWLKSPKVQVTAMGCNFVKWDNTYAGSPAIQIDEGRAIIQGNTFGEGDLHLRIGPLVLSALVVGNQAGGGLNVQNWAGRRAQFMANEFDPFEWTDEAKAHYRVDVGGEGDRRYVREGFGPEPAAERPDREGPRRWSSGNSVLKLPVLPDRAYTIDIEVYVPTYAADEANGLYLGDTRVVDLSLNEQITVASGEIPPTGKDEVLLRLRIKSWRPSEHIEGSTDNRELGVAVRSVTMRAGKPRQRVFDAGAGQWME